MLQGKPVTLEMRQPFTWASALTAGVSPSALRGPNFRRIFTGVYIHASVSVTQLVRIRAALLVHPPAAFASHTSAALVHGVPVPARAEVHIGVFEERDRRRRGGIRNHVAPRDAPVVVRGGIRVSSALQTFVELGEVLDLVDLVVVGDAFVRRECFSPKQLREYCARSQHRGARAARRAAAYVRAAVDSPMETRLRMLIVLAGLPEPSINHKVYDSAGRLLYRFDLSYPELRILVEYDGRQHRDDLDQWDHDSDRNDWFVANGWRHVPVFSRGIYRDPAKTLRRVEAALRERGAALPRRLSDDWLAHFPGSG
jgi:hypothetical protein